MDDSLNVFQKEFNIYPLWLCPMRLFESQGYPGLINPSPNEDMFVDIGAYGIPKVKDFVARF